MGGLEKLLEKVAAAGAVLLFVAYIIDRYFYQIMAALEIGGGCVIAWYILRFIVQGQAFERAAGTPSRRARPRASSSGRGCYADSRVTAAVLDRTPGDKTVAYCPAGSTEAFEFTFARIGREWRPYIDAQPSYRGRASDLHATHRLKHGRRHYVCWTDPLPTLPDAMRVAELWADMTRRYIDTGERF